MTYHYHFAGLDFLIELPENSVLRDQRQLGLFASEPAEDPHVFRFEMAETLPKPEGELLANEGGFRVYREGNVRVRYIGSVEQSWGAAYIRAEHRGRDHRILLKKAQFPGDVGVHTILTALELEHLVPQAGGVVFHASYVAHNGKAILFTAPSGTGKSTQADLWNRFRGAEIINGDRAVIRLVDGQALAEGIPFSGSSVYCENRSMPLAAVVYLGQAPKTTIKRLTGMEAFFRIWEGCSINTWEAEDMGAVSAILEGILKQVPVFRLDCTPDETAVRALEEVLGG